MGTTWLYLGSQLKDRLKPEAGWRVGGMKGASGQRSLSPPPERCIINAVYDTWPNDSHTCFDIQPALHWWHWFCFCFSFRAVFDSCYVTFIRFKLEDRGDFHIAKWSFGMQLNKKFYFKMLTRLFFCEIFICQNRWNMKETSPSSHSHMFSHFCSRSSDSISTDTVIRMTDSWLTYIIWIVYEKVVSVWPRPILVPILLGMCSCAA